MPTISTRISEPLQAPLSIAMVRNVSFAVQKPSVAQVHFDVDMQVPTKESSIDLAALEARIQRLESEKDSAANQMKAAHRKVVRLEALFPVLEQENAHLRAETELLRKEVQDLRSKMVVQQSLIVATDLRNTLHEERLTDYMEHMKKELEEVKNDDSNERILTELQACTRMAYLTKVWGSGGDSIEP